MKYEAVFGDQSLFFDAHSDCEVAGNGHYKIDCGKVMVWNFTEKCWCNSHTNTITISAMRRIIAEPKRWTLEDKKAGLLPEVGCKVATIRNFDCTVVGVDEERKNIAIQYENGKLDVVRVHCVSQIETPKEKAQREESEFVMSLMLTSVHSGTSDEYFMQGARAAYRKLKGGA